MTHTTTHASANRNIVIAKARSLKAAEKRRGHYAEAMTHAEEGLARRRCQGCYKAMCFANDQGCVGSVCAEEAATGCKKVQDARGLARSCALSFRHHNKRKRDAMRPIRKPYNKSHRELCVHMGRDEMNHPASAKNRL